MPKLLYQSDAVDLFDLELSTKLFTFVCVCFMTALISGFPQDYFRGNLVFLINDLISLLVYAIILLLALTQVVKPGVGLLVNMLETLRNLYVYLMALSCATPSNSLSGEWIQEILLITCLFATVLGLSFNKLAALFFAVLAFITQLLYLQFFPWDEFIRSQFMLTSLIMTGSLLVVYYYRSTLENLLKDLRQTCDQTQELKNRAEQLEIRNRPFVSFGQNTAGLVHDFRNDINTMSITIQTLSLRHERGKALDHSDLDRIGRALDSLNHRINMVRYVTEAGRDHLIEALDLRTDLESAAYPFRISTEVRGQVRFEFNYIGPVRIKGDRLQYLQLFENIIRNSCEALVDRGAAVTTYQAGLVSVVVARYGQRLELEFRDNAGGIPACLACEDHTCLDCSNFVVGKSSKKYGSGIGMINVFQAVRALQGRMRIDSTADGTIIAVSIPVLPEFEPEECPCPEVAARESAE